LTPRAVAATLGEAGAAHEGGRAGPHTKRAPPVGSDGAHGAVVGMAVWPLEKPCVNPALAGARGGGARSPGRLVPRAFVRQMRPRGGYPLGPDLAPK